MQFEGTIAVFWVEQDCLPKALEGLKMHFLQLLVFDLTSKTINGFSFSTGVHDDTTADRFHLFCSNLNMKKKQLTKFQTVPSTVTSRVTSRKKSLHQDAADRSKIQDFSCCNCLDLNIPGASVSLLIKWE